MSMLNPFPQSRRLQAQNVLAAAVSGRRIGGDEGHGVHKPGQHRLPLLQVKSGALPLADRSGREGIAAAALAVQLLNVDLRFHHAGGMVPPLGQQRSVLAEQLVAGEHQIGGGFSVAAGAVEVGAGQPGRLVFHQIPAVAVLSYHLIGCRQIDDDRRPVQRLLYRRRVGGPQVLAELAAQHQFRHIQAWENLVGHEQHRFAAQVQGDAQVLRGRGKPPLLIKFAVVGQMGFGHQA